MEFFLVVLIFLGLIILWLFLHYYAKPTVHINDTKKRHLWKNKSDQFDEHILFCNICEHLLSASSFICEYCSVACDKIECTKIADKSLKCKQERERRELKISEVKHHYVKGNLLETVCHDCHQEIDGVHEVGVHGTKCCWCHRAFHDACAKSDLICDFGKLRDFTIPPVSVRATRTRSAPKLHLKEITPIPEWPNWEPLIVIANRSSGSNEADQIATLFRRILNPIQVVTLSHHGPAEAIEIVKLSPVKCRILVCGGDGSVAWTLNTISEMKLDDKVSVAICPQGTGNDLSRVLNWGAEIDSNDLQSPFELIEKIKNAEPVLLDRWLVETKYDHRITLARRLHHDKKTFMYNYCSIGVDALVTLNFHKARASAFYVIKSKIMNKFLYFIYGTQQVLMHEMEGLHGHLELSIDDVKQELPDLQSVVMLNIDSWGAGVKLCEIIKEDDREFAEAHSISDRELEVFGVSSSFHIAQLQVGLTKPLKLGKAKYIKVSFECTHTLILKILYEPNHLQIKLKKVLPMQIDGEPHYEVPCEIRISSHSQARMLRKRAV
jgi:diacylglycerol kinase (ATP)